MHNGLGPRDIQFHYTNASPAGGEFVPLEGRKTNEHALQIGWTLWNISLGALFCAAAVVLYDGSPFYPSAEGCLRAILDTG